MSARFSHPRFHGLPPFPPRSTKFFACLELEESQELFEGTESLELAPHAVLFRQGDASESGIYIVTAGALGIYRQEEGPGGVAEGAWARRFA